MERVFRPFAVSLFARAARLLEWRARDHRGFGPKCGRIAPGCAGTPAADRRLARTWLPRIRNSWNKLRRVDWRIAGNCRKRTAFCRADGADRKCGTCHLAQSRIHHDAAEVAAGEHHPGT